MYTEYVQPIEDEEVEDLYDETTDEDEVDDEPKQYLGYSEHWPKGRICKILTKYLPGFTREDADELMQGLSALAVEAVEKDELIKLGLKFQPSI